MLTDVGGVQVIGVWFYEEEEAKKVAQLLQQITEQSKSAGLVCLIPELYWV